METVVTGIAAGVISGYLGVLLALKQFKAQRAFDRQLEWYERTLRALGKISNLQRQMEVAGSLGNPDLTIKASEKLIEGFADLEQCTKESVLYATQRSYDELCRMGEKYNRLKQTLSEKEQPKSERTRDALASLDATVVKDIAEANKLMHETFLELSKPIRKMLGLKAINLWNFGK